MHFDALGTFTVAHRDLAWPWVAFSAGRECFAAFANDRDVHAYRVVETRLERIASFTLPTELALDADAATRARGISVDTTGARLAVVSERELVTLAPGETMRTPLGEVAGAGTLARVVAFDRTGSRVWIACETEAGDASVLALADATTHACDETLRHRSPPFPPPAVHELVVHPHDDAVLLLASCGQDGTFARVVGFTDGPLVRIEGALDDGGLPAGFVGFSADGNRVYLAADDELRTHAWPGMLELNTAPFMDGFVSNYSGLTVGPWILVDGEDDDTGEDDVLVFDRTAIRGVALQPPFPLGMWAGRVGADALVTVDAPEGSDRHAPVAARVVRLRLEKTNAGVPS